MMTLRRKLGPLDPIVTERGIGYRLDVHPPTLVRRPETRPYVTGSMRRSARHTPPAQPRHRFATTPERTRLLRFRRTPQARTTRCESLRGRRVRSLRPHECPPLQAARCRHDRCDRRHRRCSQRSIDSIAVVLGRHLAHRTIMTVGTCDQRRVRVSRRRRSEQPAATPRPSTKPFGLEYNSRIADRSSNCPSQQRDWPGPVRSTLNQRSRIVTPLPDEGGVVEVRG